MTIKISHSKSAQNSPIESTYVGLQPQTITGEGARSTFQNIVNWRQFGQLASYYGRPDPALNGNYASDFHIVLPANHPQDVAQDQRRVGIECQCWDYTDAGSTTDFTFDGTSLESVTRTASRTQGYEEQPEGINLQTIQQYDVDDQADGYTSKIFEVDGSLVARLGVYALPEYNLTTDQAYRLNGGNFGSGQFLKGDLNNSVGTLAQFQNSTSSYTSETMTSMGRRCLAQWCHPSGVYVIGAGGSLAYTDMLDDFTFKVRPRNLRGRSYPSDTVSIDIITIARHNATTGMRFTSANTGNTSTRTFSSLRNTPFMEVVRDALDIDPDGDEIQVKCNVSSTLAVEVKTIAIFESQAGIDI